MGWGGGGGLFPISPENRTTCRRKGRKTILVYFILMSLPFRVCSHLKKKKKKKICLVSAKQHSGIK